MLTNILAFIVMLGILVLVHELGHFFAARWSGVRVERFSVGFPPKMIGKKIGETEYCLSWIPFGGYVKMAGENPGEETGAPWELQSKAVPIRMFVVGAGPLMNFLLALVILWGLLYVKGIPTASTTVVGRIEPASPFARSELQVGDRIVAVEDKPVQTWWDVEKYLSGQAGPVVNLTIERNGTVQEIEVRSRPEESMAGHLLPYADPLLESIAPDGPALQAGLQPGDWIVAIDGVAVRSWWDIQDLVRKRPDQTITVTWKRAGQSMEVLLHTKEVEVSTPEGKMEKIGQIGVLGTSPFDITKPIGVWPSLQTAAVRTTDLIGQMIRFIKRLIFRQTSPKMVGGPILIFQMAGDTARRGLETFLTFMALLSANLGFLNLLPIPALDGGHLLIFTVEGALGRRLSLRQRMIWQQIGMAILISLMILVTLNDIVRLL